ncbi:MAG: RelA/SpoT family protein, partial [Alphaproteobacteria bacterium]
MMRQYELVERVTGYDPSADEALLNRAYVYAMQAHGAQKRASGDPYFSHPLEVAGILTDLKLDDATIATALLHDTIEDTDATREEIDALFGPEIGALVEGLTKISRLDLDSKRAKQAENLRKLLLAVSDDIRVLLVKLADRLHNMRTLQFVVPEKRLRVATETMDIYAPLAGRMGMQTMREELEDLAFGVINPEARTTISDRLEAIKAKSGRLIEDVRQALLGRLAKAGLEVEIHGREKRAFSIWRKMERKSIALEQFSDIFGFRVIVQSVEECYRTLGIVHQAWPVVPGRFKDYISIPKQNDYQSLHTTIVGPGKQRVELQIRTAAMHDVAERGVAAHALYKDGVPQTRKKTKKNAKSRVTPLAKESGVYKWLSHIVDMLDEGDSPEEFLEHTRLELFHDQVFCFTPQGNLITLPRGATPIDFAYAVHTDVGNTCVGVKINGQHTPLITELENGDEVEVIRSDGQTPPTTWEKFAVTGKARSAIRRATREVERARFISLGQKILARAFTRQDIEVEDERLLELARGFGLSDLDALAAAVGRSEIASSEVVSGLGFEIAGAGPKGTPARQHTGEGWLGRARDLRQRLAGVNLRRNSPAHNHERQSGVVPIRGLQGDLPVRFAPEYGAVPGDRIVGILTPGEGITIYPIHADTLKDFDDEPDRWLDVAWDIDANDPERFCTRITVTCLNEVGALAGIAQVIGDNDANIANLTMFNRSPDFYQMLVDIEVWDLAHLNKVISTVRRLGVVSK